MPSISRIFRLLRRVSKTDAVRFAARQGIFPVESGPCQRHCVDTAAYGPEHAYTSKRVSTIETRIDPPIPIAFEKNTNILQANSARLRSFRHCQTRKAATRASTD